MFQPISKRGRPNATTSNYRVREVGKVQYDYLKQELTEKEIPGVARL